MPLIVHLPIDTLREIATNLPQRDVFAGFGQVNKVLRRTVVATPHLTDYLLWRDYAIEWNSMMASSAIVLMALHRTQVTLLPSTEVSTTGGQWGGLAGYGVEKCLTGVGTHCTMTGANREVELVVRCEVDTRRGGADPRRAVPMATHVLAVRAGDYFTSPLENFSCAVTPPSAANAKMYKNVARKDMKVVTVSGTAQNPPAWRPDNYPLAPVALPHPTPYDTATWTLHDCTGDGDNIDVAFLGVYGFWIPSAEVTVSSDPSTALKDRNAIQHEFACCDTNGCAMESFHASKLSFSPDSDNGAAA